MQSITDQEYKRACTEILEIFKYMSKEDVNKIPKQLIELFEHQKDKEYKFSLNIEQPFNKQNISETAKGLLAAIYRDYLASNEIRKQIILVDNEQRRKLKEAKVAEYNNNKLFVQRKKHKHRGRNIVTADDKAMAVYKEPWYTKVIKCLMHLFK